MEVSSSTKYIYLHGPFGKSEHCNVELRGCMGSGCKETSTLFWAEELGLWALGLPAPY